MADGLLFTMDSSNSSSNNINNPAQGLGQPLVTVSRVPVSGIRPSTGAIAPATTKTVADDHPLAPPPPPPHLPPSALMQPPPPPAAASMAQTSTTVHHPFAPAPLSAPPGTSPLAEEESTHVSISSPPSGSTVQITSFTSPPVVQISSKPVSPQKQSLESLADAFMAGPSYRLTELQLPPLLKPPPLPSNQGVERLRTLVERRAWGDVLQVAGEMLTSDNSPYSAIYASLVQHASAREAEDPQLQQEAVEILVLQCHAWLKLRRYAELGREIERWSFCRINDNTAVHPSWVPWTLQILASESLQYTAGDGGSSTTASERCIDELYGLRELLSNKKDYQLAIDAALSNVFLRQKDWRMAIETLDHLMELMPGVYQDDELLKAYQIEVLMRQGRIFLEVGALDEAETIFARAASTTVSPTRSSQWIFAKIPAQLALHQGLAQFARRSYNESMASFKQASDHLRRFPEPVHSYRLEEYLGPTIWVESPQALLTQAWNNMGLAALYTCRMKEAVRLMESLVREDPTAYLTERLAFNLCTLYELGADTAASARKKRVLQLVAKRFFLHDIGPEQFRIS